MSGDQARRGDGGGRNAVPGRAADLVADRAVADVGDQLPGPRGASCPAIECHRGQVAGLRHRVPGAGLRRAGVDQQQGPAIGGQAPRDGRADAARGAGDNG